MSRTLDERYRISEDHILGEGSSAVVYKGLDTDARRNVAIKVYKNRDEKTIADFKKSVQILHLLGATDQTSDTDVTRRLSTSSFNAGLIKEEVQRAARLDSEAQGPEADADDDGKGEKAELSLDPILDCVDLSKCFVGLLDHSRDTKGHPAVDPVADELYIVLEIGEESLEDFFNDCEEQGKTLSIDDLREIQWALVCIVSSLHMLGYVHLDIKPCNIMRFNLPPVFGPDGKSALSPARRMWRLIDLDGAVKAGKELKVDDVVTTPLYMAPEVAKFFTSLRSGANVKLSRIMDVWSVGMCSLEAIFLRPVLGPWYKEWSEETGSDSKFYTWLADYGGEPILSGDLRDMVHGMDQDMCNLLERMLTKDPAKRANISQCWAHKFFQPIRDRLLTHVTAGKRASQLSDPPEDELDGKQKRKMSKSKSSVCVAM